MKFFHTTAILLITAALAVGGEFRHVGDYLLNAHYKMSGAEMTPIPMKPIAFHVFTDGITIRLSPEGEEESYTSFEIYRSDGIGRQRSGSGALEVIPGVQASTTTDGTLRHLRLSRESLTITTFPGVSDQTIVSYAVAATPKDPAPEPAPVTP
ncbi:MAG: hypothetical protein ABJQ29_06860 [Luteolibacter sp.]